MKKRIELTLEDGGYLQAQDPNLASPPLSIDRNRKAVQERMCMKAKSLEIISDGTPGGTSIMVDGVHLGGLVRLEFVVQRGFPRVAAIVEQTYVKEDIKEYAEGAGKEETGPGDSPATITIEIFKRI